MICQRCGVELPARSRFCNYCGAALPPVGAENAAPIVTPSPLPLDQLEENQSHPRRLRSKLLIAGLAGVVALIGGISLVEHGGTDSSPDDKSRSNPTSPANNGEPEHESPSNIGTPARAVPYEITDVTVTPYDLMKNAYGTAQQIIVLEPRGRRMVDENDNVLPVRRGGDSLRFNRMIERGLALYDVVEDQYFGFYGGIHVKEVGQIAVDLRVAGTEYTMDGVNVRVPPNTEIPTDHPWNIRQIGTLEGTNAFGAPTSISRVAFCSFNTTPEHRYTPEETRERKEQRYKELNHGASILNAVDPKYPSEAIDARLEGIVTLVITVGADGKAHDIRVKDSRGQHFEFAASWIRRNPDRPFSEAAEDVKVQPLGHGLEEAAIQCVRDSSFNPGVQDGQPVETQDFEVKVKFRLPDEVRALELRK